MKKTIKLIPAALALLALASCSNDELLGEKTIEVSSQYQLAVEAENCSEAGTRAGHVIIGKAREVVWQTGDKIRTYDDALGNFDEYANTTATASLESNFGLYGATTPALSSHKYAVFPSEYVNTLGWGKVEGEKTPILTMDIPTTGINLNDNFGNEFTAEDGKKYTIGGMYLPMWGPVKAGTETAENPQVKVVYMTAFLQVDLNAIPATATNLIIYAPNGEPLSGRFEAALDSENPTEAVLKADKTKYLYSNKIDVSINGSSIAGKDGTIYLPIIAEQFYKNLFVLAKVGGKTEVIKNYGPAYTATTADATAVGLTNGTPYASDTPDNWKETAGTPPVATGNYIEKLGHEVIATGQGFKFARKQAVKCDKTFEQTATCAYPSDITTALALYGDASSLTLNISNSAEIQCSAANNLVEIPTALQNSDITLNITNGVSIVATVSDLVFKGKCKSLTVNVGNGTTTTFTPNGKGIDFSQVNGDVTLEAATAATDYNTIKAQNTAGKTFTYGENIINTVTLDPQKADIVVAEGATLGTALVATTNNVTVNGVAASITTTTGDIELAPATPAAYAGTLTTTTGKITIDNKEYAVAKVVKSGAGEIALNNGIISALDLDAVPAAATVTVNSKGLSEIDPDGYDPTGVTATVVFNSTWDYVPTAGEMTNVTKVAKIYTATQLAKGSYTGNATLLTNVTISEGKAWTPVDLAVGFTAPDVTISGLNAPLFGTIGVAGGLAISDVTISGSNIAEVSGETGVGLLAEATTANGAISITKTSVVGSIASDANTALHYAGGLIGKAAHTGALTIGGATDADKVSVEIAFTNNGKLYGTSGRDQYAGTIGQVIGSNTSTGTIDIKATTVTNGTFDKSSAGLKFQNFRNFNADFEIQNYFKGASNLIGRCTGTGAITLGANTYLKTPAYASLNYASATKTVTGTVYALDPIAEADAKADIKTAKGIADADYDDGADPVVDNVIWNQTIEVLNSLVEATY